jgi:hypothetical protein
MGRLFLVLIFAISVFFTNEANGQCSICTKTAQQMGHKPAKGLNAGIIYLMVAPLAIIGIVGFRWWRNHIQE